MSTDDSDPLSHELRNAFARCTATIIEGRIVPALRALRQALYLSQASTRSTEGSELLSQFAAILRDLENSLLKSAVERVKEMEAQAANYRRLEEIYTWAATREQIPPGTPPPDLTCSFWGKKQDEGAKLIAGPKVFIGKECVALCNEIIGSEEGDSAPT